MGREVAPIGHGMAVRESWTRLWVFLGAALASLAGCGGAAAPGAPNVVLIVVDTLRADHLGAYGYGRATSPSLDRLASGAVRFERAISPAPWTMPAVAGLLTGQYPSALGIRDHAVELDERFPLLSELLREHGWTTHGIVSHDMLSARLGFGRGFDAYDEEVFPEHQGISSPELTRKALAFLRREHEQPFFLFLHYFDPHYDYMLHRDFDFSTPYAGPLVSGDPILDLWQRLDELTPRDAEFLVSLYDSEVAFTDHHIGLVLDELDAQGRFADAVVVVTADHGEEFMERGWLGHSVTLYQELVRVPLLVKLPGVAPRVVETPVSLLDVAPTLLDFLGIQAPPNLDGRVLDLEGEVLEGPVYSETYNPQIHRPGRAHPISLRAIVSGRWKLVLDGIGGRATLYDLAADPGERAGRPAWGHPRGESLERELRDWARRMSRKRGLGPAPNAEELFTPEQRENLEALGYLAPRESE